MKLYRNFKCKSCKAEYNDKLIDSEVKSIECECGEQAVKTLSATKFIFNSCGKNASWN